MPMMPRPSFVVAGCAMALLLTGCSKEQRVTDGLIRAGLSETMATCMARPLAEKLSYNQLEKLANIGRLRDMDMRDASLADVMEEMRALDDPQILAVTTRAALGCALTG